MESKWTFIFDLVDVYHGKQNRNILIIDRRALLYYPLESKISGTEDNGILSIETYENKKLGEYCNFYGSSRMK